MSTTLTSHDQRVLQALIDAGPVADGPAEGDSTTVFEAKASSSPFASLKSKEAQILSKLSNAEPAQGTIAEAVEELNKIVEQFPEYASAYVNRAQARRMLLPTPTLFTEQSFGQTSEVLKDLERGLSLAAGNPSRLQSAQHQLGVLAAAYTHKGYLLLAASDVERNEGLCLRKAFGTDDPIVLEEMACKAFTAGGECGNQNAKRMAVKTNPYAKMCGAIVKEAICKEMQEYCHTV